MEEVNKKINDLYQSHKKEIRGKGLVCLSAILFLLSAFCFVSNIFSKGVIERIIYGYVVVAFAGLATLSFVSYVYIYNDWKTSQAFSKIIITFYKILLIVCMVISIPLIIYLKITEVILNYRAKKLENLENGLIIFAIDFTVILIFIHMDIWIVEKISESIIYFIERQSNCIVAGYPLQMFLLLSLFKMEVDAVNMVILKVMNRFGMSKIKRKINEKQKNKSDKNDIYKNTDERNRAISEYEEKQKESLKYDLEYLKKTVWKYQLMWLIILFFVATFIPDLLFEGHQSDAINVITIFTLIMLYLDKRKEWR